jgi:uracil-DNA glycosylase family 4
MIEKIIARQREFQKNLAKFPIDSNLESDRNELSEGYVLKMIGEIMEFTREFPSAFNKLSKHSKEADMTRIKEELSDVFLYFCNLLLTWRISWPDFLEAVTQVQNNNFVKVKEKLMKALNDEIIDIPGYTCGIGSGSVMPKYVFIGQNPGEDMPRGYKFWSNPSDGSSKVLLPALDAIGVRQDCYFTNIMKCPTDGNREPTDDEIAFWREYLIEELSILRAGNPDMKIVLMGAFVQTQMSGSVFLVNQGSTSPILHVKHPAYVLRGGMTQDDYLQELKNVLL